MAIKAIKSRAEILLNSNKSVKERASKYSDRIKTTLNTKLIVSLQEDIESIDDKIFDLTDFSLKTDVNKGLKKLTKEDCQTIFEEVIKLEVEKQMLTLELKLKTEAFENLFGKI